MNLKRIGLLWLLLSAVTVGAMYAQNWYGKTINRSGSSSSQYMIIFHSYPAGTRTIDGSTSRFGHVYVEFIDQTTGNNELRGMDRSESFWSSDWGQLQRENNALRHMSTKRLLVWVNRTQFNNAKAITGGYYFAGFNDCVTYAKNVASRIGVNYSWNTLFPDSLLDDFIRQN